jgi:two-component system sensor histidine kinase DesK
MADSPPPAAAVAKPERTGKSAWSRWIWLAYLFMYPLPWFINPPTTTGLVVSAAAVALFLLMYMRHWDVPRPRLIAIASMTVVLSFVLQPFGGLWGVFTIYGVAMLANLRPTRDAVVAIVAISLALVAFAWWRDLHWTQWGFTLFMGVMIGASTILFAQLEESNRRLAESRESARQLAVVAERERIARDLHDLLGHTLTVVAVKADLAAKLVARDPSRAAAEIDDIRTTARAALADIRAAVTGMRSTTLASEIVQARQALGAAGVTLHYDALHTPLPQNIESILSFVIREGVTNIVRHAEASRCDIKIEQARDGHIVLELSDDGKGTTPREGNGLRGMRARLAEVAGSLTLTSGRGTLIRAEIPLPSAAEAQG